MSRTTGVLLVNLGTPEAPTPDKVRAYLSEFLMDPLVVDIPWVLRWPLVHLFIVPRRAPASAELYRKIWTAEGSPLLVHTRGLTAKLAEALGPAFCVRFAMRYGSPSIAGVLRDLGEEALERILVCPLYPQYARATWESTRRAVERAASGAQPNFLPPFFDEPGFINAWARQVLDTARGRSVEHFIFSFHGLPARQALWADKSGNTSYRTQCFSTAREIAEVGGIPEDRYTVAFQSRLGPMEWIRPYTDAVLGGLAQRGVRRVAVACPSFTCDCLETLEEVALRYRSEFRRRGGEELYAVPCLNAAPDWVEALAGMVRQATEDGYGEAALRRSYPAQRQPAPLRVRRRLTASGEGRLHRLG